MLILHKCQEIVWRMKTSFTIMTTKMVYLSSAGPSLACIFYLWEIVCKSIQTGPWCNNWSTHGSSDASFRCRFCWCEIKAWRSKWLQIVHLMLLGLLMMPIQHSSGVGAHHHSCWSLWLHLLLVQDEKIVDDHACSST